VEVTHALSNPPPTFEQLGRRGSSTRYDLYSEPVARPTQIQTRLDEAQRSDLLRRYVAGERAYELASLFGVDRRTVAHILDCEGVKRSRSMTADEIAEAIERYNRGESCAEIGRALTRNHGTIWLALKAAGVDLRDPQCRCHGTNRTR